MRKIFALALLLTASSIPSYGQGIPAAVVCNASRTTVDLYATVAIQAVIAKVSCGERVTLMDRVSGWALVVTQAGKHGYIDQQYVGLAAAGSAQPAVTSVPATPAAPQPVPQAVAPIQTGEQTLHNNSIVRLVQAGLTEDTILTVISSQPGEYSTSANDLVALKSAGVSDRIIAAMLGKTPKATADLPAASPPAKDAPPEVDSQSFRDNHGLYYQQPDKLTPMEGQVISFERSGSLLASKVTFGIISRKGNVQILGRTSGHVTSSEPVFYYRAAAGTEAAGGSAGDLVLLKIIPHGNRRQFEVVAGGDWRGSAGPSIRSQLQVVRKQIEPDLYRISPAEKLKLGEYAFYLFRGYQLPGFLFDFTVE